jgi:acetyltransferase-like isoleucine patch superfamily enzyme
MGGVALAVGRRALRRLAPAGLRRRLVDERHNRRMAAFAARALMPPPRSAFAAFGTGSVIVPPARVTMPEAIEIGDRVVISEHAWLAVTRAVDGFEPRLVIRDEALIERMCHIACVGEVEIGPKVSIGERVLIGDTFHRYDDVNVPVIDQPMADPQKVTIERGAHLGLACLIMPGVTIGENATVGAGAVVTRDVPPRAVVVGNPARVVTRWDEDSGTWVSP